MIAARRHLLVIASQCRRMNQLDQLEEVARELHTALLDEELGGCVPGLPHGRPSLYYDKLSSAEIRVTVEDAIRYAGDQGATLVLALLGHGFTPGDAPTLYLMGTDAVEGDPLSAVEVGSLLRNAADRPGVNGVIGIVDTCHAAGSLPSAHELTTGLRAGQTRLALLMASTVAQSAFGLQLSRKLSALIHQGINDAGPALSLGDIATPLRNQIGGQTVGSLDYNADPSADSSLWLCANTRHDDKPPRSLLGSLGQAELSTALRQVEADDSMLQEPQWDPEALQQLTRELAKLNFSPQRERALRAAESALIAQRTVKFLRSWPMGAVNTRRLRSALTYLRVSERRLLPVPLLTTDVEAVDSAAFDYPATDRGCQASVAKFVLLLANEAGLDTGVSDPQWADRLDQWARSINARVHVSDAAEFIHGRQKEQHLRLVISLHTLAGDWPENVEAWLLRDGELFERRSFGCETVDQTGAEDAVGEAVAWADVAAEKLDLRLRRVDIAAPVTLLLKWRPEEVLVDNEYLGVNHEVVAHWSQRLDPPRVARWILKAAANRMPEITNPVSGTPIDWLGKPQTRDLAVLLESLRSGTYMRGIALEHDPAADTSLMELLMSYIPVVLWPQPKARFPAARRSCVDRYWGSLPVGFLIAYRLRWSGKQAEDIVDLRAAWDDQEWLHFCTRVAGQPIGKRTHTQLRSAP